jgi:hypothetical protein
VFRLLEDNPIPIDAVKQWKYVPSETTDTFEVKLDFVPHK